MAGLNGVPPWIARQRERLLRQRGHAWLLQGPSGLGQYALALELARAWLCDAPGAQGACGQCASCHAIDVRAHTDLFVLMPESLMLELDWPLGEKAQEELDEKKRKPSREIRVDAMRDAVEFAQRTSGRGRGKVVLVYPAERMNNVTANTLLKTLEEPPGDLRFVLASESAHQLLPTIRSRCQAHTMEWPPEGEAIAWLDASEVPAKEAAALLRNAGGRPEDAMALHRAGRSAGQLPGLPRALARGDATAFSDWAPAEIVSFLQRICHDLLAVKAGGEPRFFRREDLPQPGSWAALTQWARELSRTARTAEHPFNVPLMVESLVSQARSALNSAH